MKLKGFLRNIPDIPDIPEAPGMKRPKSFSVIIYVGDSLFADCCACHSRDGTTRIRERVLLFVRVVAA